MNATTNKPTMTVSLAESPYGNPRPQIDLRFSPGTTHRQVRAATYTLAARAELATPGSESWVVETESGETQGRVWIELLDGDPNEVARAMKVLGEVAK